MTRKASPREEGGQVRLEVWMPEPLRDAVMETAKVEYTNNSEIVRRALKLYLRKLGRLPKTP